MEMTKLQIERCIDICSNRMSCSAENLVIVGFHEFINAPHSIGSSPSIFLKSNKPFSTLIDLLNEVVDLCNPEMGAEDDQKDSWMVYTLNHKGKTSDLSEDYLFPRIDIFKNDPTLGRFYQCDFDLEKEVKVIEVIEEIIRNHEEECLYDPVVIAYKSPDYDKF